MLRRNWGLILCLMTLPASAEEVKLAVAANFTAAINALTTEFAQESGHQTRVSHGSTGKLYTQIRYNAPFDIFLAADQRHPHRLHTKDKLGHAPFTYAIGKLVLWSRTIDRKVSEATLKAADFRRIALANPKTAPYGIAAQQVMTHLKLINTLRPKWIQGDNAAQTYQFVASGNVELGFIALAHIALKTQGTYWLIPQTYYTPIRQDALLLRHGINNPAAQAFITYLQSPQAQAIIKQFGYEISE